jgi:Divergent InlB B-repeat domain
MKRSYFGLALGALVVVGAVLSLPSCGHDQKLMGITVSPPAFTFLTVSQGQTTTFKAYGSYIHPPSMKDITTQVTWNADVPQVITVASGAAAGGTVTTAGGCGLSDISATAPEGTGGASNIVVGFGSVTVNDPNNKICPGGSSQQATLAVILAGTAQGTVTSIPAGATCPGPCGALFTVGSLVVLNATPNGRGTFESWSGCTPGNPTTSCSLTMPANGILVTATFQ